VKEIHKVKSVLAKRANAVLVWQCADGQKNATFMGESKVFQLHIAPLKR
jgi:hypothetical protein